jgi:chromosome segregation ATPase
MVKKTILAGGALALLAALVFGRSAVSYISTVASLARETVRESVPVELDLRRARDEIQALEPEIQKNRERIAKEEAQIDKLSRKVLHAEEGLTVMKGEMLRLTSDLETNSTEYFVYAQAGRELNFTRAQVKRDLQSRFTQYQKKEEEKSQYDNILAARRDTLAAAREKLSAMQSAKSSLEVEVERLGSKLEMVNVAKAKSEFKFDDSKLSRVRKLIEEIDTRIDVQAKLADTETTEPYRIPLEEPVHTSDITEQVHDYFSQPSGLAKQ